MLLEGGMAVSRWQLSKQREGRNVAVWWLA